MRELLNKLPDAYTLIILALTFSYILGAPAISYYPWITLIVGSAAGLEAAITKIVEKKARISKSTIISAMIIAGVADPTSPLTVGITLLLIAFKHACRYFKGPFPLVNPAAGALFVLFLLRPELELWWANSNLLFVGALGTLVALKINRLAVSVTFLAAWTAIALAIIHPFPLGLHHFPFFLAFYMLTEPKTTPVRVKDQALFGVAVAVMEHSFSIVGLPSGALLALVVANAAYRVPQVMGKVLKR